ncbi:hypothetical protein [Spirosoma fluminis]
MVNVVCFLCKHTVQPKGDEMECHAFPNGIPRSVITGEREHFSVLPDQTGDYVFEPADPEFVAEFHPDLPIPQPTADVA